MKIINAKRNSKVCLILIFSFLVLALFVISSNVSYSSTCYLSEANTCVRITEPFVTYCDWGIPFNQYRTTCVTNVEACPSTPPCNPVIRRSCTIVACSNCGLLDCGGGDCQTSCVSCPSSLGTCDSSTTCDARTCSGTTYYCRSINGGSYNWVTSAPTCDSTQCGTLTAACGGLTFTCAQRSGVWDYYQTSDMNFLTDSNNCGSFCTVCSTSCSNGICAAPCGAENQACCSGSTCNSGLLCTLGHCCKDGYKWDITKSKCIAIERECTGPSCFGSAATPSGCYDSGLQRFCCTGCAQGWSYDCFLLPIIY